MGSNLIIKYLSLIQSMNKIDSLTQFLAKGGTQINLKQWLFGVRLKFIEPEQNHSSGNFLAKQDFFMHFNFAEAFKINQEGNIDQIYEVFRQIIRSFRFNQKNIQKTFKESKEVLKNRYKINDVESSMKKKIKKLQDVFRLDQSQAESLKKVLNHKNVIIHLTQIYQFAQSIFSSNFQQITQGFYSIINGQLSKGIQIKLNILMMDIIILINEIKYMFFPAICSQKPTKLQIQQKKILEEELSQLQSYQILKQLKFIFFFQKVKILIQDLEDQEQKIDFRLWVEIFQIKKEYLVDETGVWRRQRNLKIQSTFLQQINIYWWCLSNQFVHRTFYPTKQYTKINFTSIFKQYKILFNFILSQKGKNEEKQEKIQQIIKYLDLIQQIWMRIDEYSALEIFEQQMNKIYSCKIHLPKQYLYKSKSSLQKIKNQAIGKYLSVVERQFINRIKQQVDNLSHDLIQINQQETLYGYLKKHYETIRRLLKELSYSRNYPQILEEQLISEKSTFNDLQVINKIKQKCKNLDFQNIPNNFSFSQNQEHEVIKQLERIVGKQKFICEQIKYFLIISRCILFQNKTSTQNLQNCRNYYSSIRERIFYKKISQTQQSNNNSYGIKYVIRILTYQLICCIQLSKPEVQDLIKKIFNLLRLFKKITTTLSNQGNVHEHLDDDMQTIDDNDEQNDDNNDNNDNYDNDEQSGNMMGETDEQLFKDMIIKKNSSQQVEQNRFYIQDFRNGSHIGHNHGLIYLKKIYELRTQILANKIKSFRRKQLKFAKNYCELKKKIYQFAGRGYQNNESLLKDIDKLPEIQFDFERERYYDGWKKLRKLNNLELIFKVLNKNWSGSYNLAKIFINTFFQYQQTCSTFFQSGQLSEEKIRQMISKIFPVQEQYMRQRLREAIKILDDIQKIQFLRKQRQEQRIQNLHQKKIKSKPVFDILSQKVSIETIQKNGVRIFKKYTVLKISNTCYTKIYEKIKKLSLLNRRIFVEGDLLKGSISIKIDEMQNSFETFALAVRRLIKQYVQIIKFCRNQLHFDLYPLIKQSNIKIEKRQNRIYCQINPYEGILLNILLSFDQIKQLGYYRYPKFPFIELADELREKFKIIYEDKKYTAEYYTFYHLLQEMKAISMQPQNNTLEITANNILKCPYFWSTSEKLFQIVQFKEIYQTGINVQQGRRKQNQKRRSQLGPFEKQAFSTLLPQKQRHKQYKTAYGYHKTTQIYFSIEGVLQKQAFLEDIGSFKQKSTNLQQEEKNYKYHTYWWLKYQDLISNLIEIVAERERKKGSQKSTIHQKTFNSFQNHIRNLRNLAVHYIYDGSINKQYDTQQKINIFQENFPKIFIFIYRWRKYIGKDFTNVIKPQRINLLKQLFVNESNPQMIQKLESIKELSQYKISNTNKALFKLFNFDYEKTQDCQPCVILCASMKKTTSFWNFLEDIQIQKGQKTNPFHDSRYNVLFFDHQKAWCNGLQYLLGAFTNSIQRNKFTSEQLPFVSEESLDKDYQEKNGESRKKTKFDQQNYERRDRFMEQLSATDYVCKYFIFQLEMRFPYLFHDIRKQRYQWDPRATEYPVK